MNKFAIVACADRRQLPAACVALLTAGENIKFEVQLIVVGQDCTLIDIKNVAEFCRVHSVIIRFIPFRGLSNVGKDNVGPGHITSGAYLRLHLDDLLPGDLERVLYIDADTITKEDITALFAQDMHGLTLAAAPEIYVETRLRDHLPQFFDVRKNGYFTSGILLFDWQQTLKTQLLVKARAFIETKPKIRFHDQDCMNYVIQGEWLRLSAGYNGMMHLQSAGQKLIIAHFAGLEKPWLPNYYIRQLGFRSKYKCVLGATPWHDFVRRKTLMGWLIVVWEPVMWWRQRRVGREWQRIQKKAH